MNPKEKPENKDAVKLIASGKLPTDPLGIVHLSRELLNKLSPTLQILLALFGLGVAIFFGVELRNRLNNNHKNIEMALRTKLETTAHPHKGIAAFVLSGLEKTLPSRQDYITKLGSTLTKIDNKLKELTDAGKTFPTDEDLKSLKIHVDNMEDDSGSAWQKVIISKASASRYLMVPAISLRREGLNEDPLDDKDAKKLEEVLKYNREVLFDLCAASTIETFFKELDHEEIQKLPVVQTYFISESGVILLRAPHAIDKSKYYQDQFAAYTLFMDRPYFWNAVNPRYANQENGTFYHITEPYIDLGGNGLVITYSQRVTLPNRRAGVICVDVQLHRSSVEEIIGRLEELGADVQEFTWMIDPCDSAVNDAQLPDNFKWFKTQFNAQRRQKDKSRFLGAIALQSDLPSEPKPEDAMGVISFTVPLESRDLGEGKRSTTLLGARFDFTSIKRKLTRDLIWFSAGIILLVLVSSNIVQEYTGLKREMNNVLEKMSKVMSEAYTPFAWLNENNEFHKVNDSFVKLLGYNNEEDLKLNSPKFRGLITTETQPIYDEVLEQSARGEETGKYEIDVITKEGEVLHVVVHGERIPYPTFWRRGQPHRFGVFLQWPKERE